jgi:hypothetical protein
MPRRVSRRRLVVAAVLVVLTVLPNIVSLYDGTAYRVPRESGATRATVDDNYPVVGVCFLNRPLFNVEASSAERAQGIAYRWEQYRRYSWILATVAGLILVREFLPVPRLFGRDDD